MPHPVYGLPISVGGGWCTVAVMDPRSNPTITLHPNPAASPRFPCNRAEKKAQMEEGAKKEKHKQIIQLNEDIKRFPRIGVVGASGRRSVATPVGRAARLHPPCSATDCRHPQWHSQLQPQLWGATMATGREILQIQDCPSCLSVPVPLRMALEDGPPLQVNHCGLAANRSCPHVS